MPSTPAAAVANPRFRLLDGLRLVAALMVVAYHYFGRNQPFWGEPVPELFPLASKFASYGALGVQLFFIISGFVILMSAQGRPIASFVASRISRLFPAYWFAVLATAAMMTWLAAPGMFRQPSIEDVLLNLTMTQEAFGAPSIDGVYWTLWVELLFYVLVAVMVLIGITERRVLALAFLWPLIGAIAMTMGDGFIAELLSAQYAPFFAAGMVLYLIYQHGHSTLRWLVFGFASLSGIYQTVTHYVLGPMSANTGRELSPLIATLILIGLLAVVAIATLTPLAHRGPRWLVVAGLLTYPVYLIHENWGWWMISWLSPLIGKWPTVAATTLTVLVAAWLIERFIERPLRPRLSNAIKRSLGAPGKRPGESPEDSRSSVAA
ncbi:acyltransferase family protein [Agromyces mediolanus]|uniref:acyltransferase family protein n=1 Tax=Agromyces mediolanus TaxID=41986 RepID=UPI001E47B799|nr:acyltransferase [Agromyces mediolanus]MCD1570479.1 acyltransferase [Agromyces mediolanus]